MATVYRRGRVWWARLQWHGEEIRRSTGSASKPEAIRFLDQLKADLRRVERGGQPRHRYDEAMSRFIQEHLPTQKPAGAYRYLISAKVLSKHFAGLYLDEITKGRLSDFVQARRAERVKDATIRRDLACLSSMMAQAINWDWATENPVKALRKKSIRESAPRIRFLTREEYRSLLGVAPPDLRPLIVLAVHTGMRLGEILALEWGDVDLSRRELQVRESKNSAPRRIPLSKGAVGTLVGTPRHIVSRLVFPRSDGRQRDGIQTSKAMARVIAAAGIKDFRFHDLRHTFASWAVQRGHDLYRIQKILGHKGPQMTQRYAHLRTEDLHRVVGTEAGTAETDFLE